MPTAGKSAPCPPRGTGPQADNMQIDPEPTPANSPLITDAEFTKRVLGYMARMEAALVNLPEELAKIRKLNKEALQAMQLQVKAAPASVKHQPPKVWQAAARSSHKRHTRLSEKKKNRFQEQKDRGAVSIQVQKDRGAVKQHEPVQSTSTAMPPAAPVPQHAAQGEDNDMHADIPSPGATINTERLTPEEEERNLINRLLIPRRPALERAINAWRSQIQPE